MDHLDETQRTLGRIEGKLDLLLANVDNNTERVTTLEKQMAGVKATAGIVAVVVGTLASLFSGYFNKA